MIKTKNLLLLPFSKDLISDEYLSWLNDRELMRYSEQRHLPHTYESCIKYFQSFQGTPHQYFAILDNETKKHLGNINAYIDAKNLTGDMGILIGKDHGGKGVGLEAWNALMHYLFTEKKLRKITAGTMVTNLGMLKIFEKSGMIKEGQKREQLIFDGASVDVILVGILKTEFEKCD